MDFEYKELKEKAYNELYPITSYVANLLRDEKLVHTKGKQPFAMFDGKYCIVGWAYGGTNDYGIKGNPKFCEKCDDFSMKLYDDYDGRQASKRLLVSILKFTEHFKSTHK